MLSQLANEAPPEDFPNYLEGRAPFARPLRPVLGLLVLLVLLAIVPRAIVACRLDVLCKDGVFYVELSQALERGDLEAGLGKMRLNTYPVILMLLHRAGLEWELASKIWGVLISALVVLPLFGWLRRQFNDSVALAGCLLYAFHPKLVSWSPELIRDPTFWFFLSCGMYATWRAVTEVRWSWFAAAGLAITLAIHTRFEGWFLFIPLVWWSIQRYRSLATQRRRVAQGVVLALAVCPMALLLVNVTWLRDQPRWEWGNFVRLQYVAWWADATWQKIFPAPPQDAPVAAANADSAPAATQPATSPAPSTVVTLAAIEPALPPIPFDPPPRMSSGALAWTFFNTLRRGMDGVFGLLWLVGIWRWRRVWFRSDQWPLAALALCVLGGIFVHLWYAQASSSRYVLAIVLVGLPSAAIAWWWLCRALAGYLQKAPDCAQAQRRVLAASIAVIALLGWGEAFTDRYDGRQREAALGKWMLQQYGPGHRLLGSNDMSLAEYYAQATLDPAPDATLAGNLKELLATRNPDLAVCSMRRMPDESRRRLLLAAEGTGFAPVAADRLPTGYRWHDLLILTRSDRLSATTSPREAASGREQKL